MAKKEDAIAKKEDADLAIPDWVKAGDRRGMEHLTRDDLKLPRIALAQALSPQIDEAKIEYIPGLKKGEMFNTLSKEIYGIGPLEFCVIRADKPRGVEFYPIDSGGGVKDLDVPLTDPRMQFTKDEKGTSVKPVATKFYDFIVALLPVKGGQSITQQVVALSFKGSGLDMAKQLNTFMSTRGTPCFTGKYSLTSTQTTNKKGFTFGIFVVKNAGWLDEETGAMAEAAYEAIKDRKVVVERIIGEDDDETGEAPQTGM